jgi:DedD protein
MARAISDEELQLKRRARRRLIGAIVLVAAMVIVLPMVLDTEPGPVSQEITVRIPSTDAEAFMTKVAPPPAPKAAESKVSKPQVEEKTAIAPEPAKEAPKPASKPEAAKPAKTPAKPAAKTAKPASKPAGGQFVVQVIALADADKAQRMQQQITAAGIKSYTEVVKTVKGDVTRVRAGPFATREAAEKARDQLKSLGMNGNVTAR